MAFATTGQITEAEKNIISILNAATGGFNASINDSRRNAELITSARRRATEELIKAIAENRQHSYWGVLASDVTVAHDAYLPEHIGKHGIPLIIQASGTPRQLGMEADADDIDSWRNDTLGLFTRFNGETVPHNDKDSNNQPSPISGYYAIINKKLKFTGYSCVIPMIQLPADNTWYDTHTPSEYISTVIKLALFYCFKEGDNVADAIMSFYQEGQRELGEIKAGTFSPVASDVSAQQKEL